ncbi:MAG: FAD-dependent oxidoreductase, partial [Chloroflexi bacterium]|nr:FAD-dependent oxidoreductase [Chloroflexota bacterium]
MNSQTHASALYCGEWRGVARARRWAGLASLQRGRHHHHTKGCETMLNGPSVCVIGGGIAGLTAALNLAGRGVRVSLVERSASLGGNAVTVCCKAVKGQCQICGGCLLSDRLTDLRKAKDIEVFLETAVN